MEIDGDFPCGLNNNNNIEGEGDFIENILGGKNGEEEGEEEDGGEEEELPTARDVIFPPTPLGNLLKCCNAQLIHTCKKFDLIASLATIMTVTKGRFSMDVNAIPPKAIVLHWPYDWHICRGAVAVIASLKGFSGWPMEHNSF